MVKTIFEKFSKGEKTAAITDWLNASGIPCSFRTRIAAANQRRINKGIAPAKYKRGNVDNMIWRTTTVNRIVKNKVYIGVQHHKSHEPDPSNPLPSRKRKNRVLLTEFDVQTPHTRIIDDELFLRVNKIFEQRAFNRNQSDEIMSDCSLVKDYIHEYITDIVLYKPDESWVLVIVHFVDGSERWGTIKNERYKKSELRQYDLFDKVK